MKLASLHFGQLKITLDPASQGEKPPGKSYSDMIAIDSQNPGDLFLNGQQLQPNEEMKEQIYDLEDAIRHYLSIDEKTSIQQGWNSEFLKHRAYQLDPCIIDTEGTEDSFRKASEAWEQDPLLNVYLQIRPLLVQQKSIARKNCGHEIKRGLSNILSMLFPDDSSMPSRLNSLLDKAGRGRWKFIHMEGEQDLPRNIGISIR